ncbi:MAG: PhoH family protein [Clostridia bacterium]|nr:PhoH family protein [Clostridia bacterium]
MEMTFNTADVEYLSVVFGPFDENIEAIEKELSVRIISRGDMLSVSGENENVDRAVNTLKNLLEIAKTRGIIDIQTVKYVISLSSEKNCENVAKALDECICITSHGRPIKPKTISQKKYVESINKNVVTFGVGPAGTGKTYLAVALAVTALKSKTVSKIILTRPAVEAGESLGFLPGDLQNKVDPYLRPLYDALFDMLGADTYLRYMEKGIIEIAPLAYMRGRTLENSFIILDEAQNTTIEQMKMFLTRFGFNSKIVVTGDVTQVDLPRGKTSGLVHALKILDNIDLIGVHKFDKKDIVRHALVQKIVDAYENANRKGNANDSKSIN